MRRVVFFLLYDALGLEPLGGRIKLTIRVIPLQPAYSKYFVPGGQFVDLLSVSSSTGQKVLQSDKSNSAVL